MLGRPGRAVWRPAVALVRGAAVLGAGSMAAALAGALTGCAALATDGPRPSGAGGGPVRVVAAFAPLVEAARQAGGARVEVSSLTRPGAEPHDVELAARDVARLVDADVVVYLRGFQPAVDEALRQRSRAGVVDVASAARLTDWSGRSVRGPVTGEVDPHFWLDPARMASVVRVVAQALSAADAGAAPAYQARAGEAEQRLAALDGELRVALAHCRTSVLVTSHEAFGYLARAYGLEQVGISGADPEAEPPPARVAAAARLVADRRVPTVFYARAGSSDLARTVAREAGARTAALDPLETVTASGSARSYVVVLRDNLATLTAGLDCR